MLEQQLAALAEATVGKDDYRAAMKRNQLVGLHNQFMELTNDRFTADLKRGKLNEYINTKAKVERGIMIYNALLNRAVK
jgi:lipase chaperone LimK